MTAKKHDTKRSETQLVGEVRIAYPYHQEHRTKSAGGTLLDNPHYASVVMSPKLGPAETCPNYKRLSDMAMEAATKAWNGWPDGGVWPIQDGDIPFPHKPKPGETPMTPQQLAERNKWRVGYWIVDVTNYLKVGPKVSVLTNGVLQDVPAQTVAGVQVYKSGDFGYVSMNAYTFHSDKPGGKWGVNFGYEGVAYTRQGELIGSSGQKSAAQMFAGIPVVQGAPPIAPAQMFAGIPVVQGAPPIAPAAPVAPGGAPALPMPVAAPTAPSAPAGPGPIPTGSAAPSYSGPTGVPPIPGR